MICFLNFCFHAVSPVCSGFSFRSVPEMDDEIVSNISKRYIDLFEKITGKTFKPRSYENIEAVMFESISKVL